MTMRIPGLNSVNPHYLAISSFPSVCFHDLSFFPLSCNAPLYSAYTYDHPLYYFLGIFILALLLEAPLREWNSLPTSIANFTMLCKSRCTNLPMSSPEVDTLNFLDL